MSIVLCSCMVDNCSQTFFGNFSCTQNCIFCQLHSITMQSMVHAYLVVLILMLKGLYNGALKRVLIVTKFSQVIVAAIIVFGNPTGGFLQYHASLTCSSLRWGFELTIQFKCNPTNLLNNFYSGGGEGGKRRRSSIAHLTELLKDWGIRDKDKLRSNTVDRGENKSNLYLTLQKKQTFSINNTQVQKQMHKRLKLFCGFHDFSTINFFFQIYLSLN